MTPAEQRRERTEVDSEKERWELRVKKAEFWYKVLIMIVGSVAVAAFLVYQHRQTENRNFTELMSSRETADSQLRAEMFKTLFDAYFKSKVQSVAQGGPSPVDVLDTLRQEVMLSDVLARNFENIDIRPIFEDLDRRLTSVIEAADQDSSSEPTKEQFLAFKQREELRRVAVGATSRQVASLAALEGDAKSLVTHHRVTQRCKEANDQFEIAPDLPDVIAHNSSGMKVIGVNDGAVVMRFIPPDGHETDAAFSRPLNISFYDMPTLENMFLKNGERVAFSLNLYVSREACERFGDALDPRTRKFCPDVGYDSEYCALTSFRTVILPKKFLGLHDRPFHNDLAVGRYRDPWWKLW